MKTLAFLLIFAATLSPRARAGNEIGNGGLGLWTPNKNHIDLLDFAENGLSSAYYNENIETDPGILARVVGKLRGTFCVYDQTLCAKIAHKFSELKSFDPVLANALFFAFESLQFRVVDARLVPVEDVGVSPINYDRGLLVQLATRIKDVVRFDSAGANYSEPQDRNSKLDLDHQVGLFFHEVIYAIRGSSYVPEARDVRETVGYLFGSEALQGLPLLKTYKTLPMFALASDSGGWRSRRSVTPDGVAQWKAEFWAEGAPRSLRIIHPYHYPDSGRVDDSAEELTYDTLAPSAPFASKPLARLDRVCGLTGPKIRISVQNEGMCLIGQWWENGENGAPREVARIRFRTEGCTIGESMPIQLDKDPTRCEAQIREAAGVLLNKLGSELAPRQEMRLYP